MFRPFLYAEKAERRRDEGRREECNRARDAKDYAKSDEIRDRLKAMDVVLKDTPQGVIWSIEK